MKVFLFSKSEGCAHFVLIRNSNVSYLIKHHHRVLAVVVFCVPNESVCLSWEGEPRCLLAVPVDGGGGG